MAEIFFCELLLTILALHRINLQMKLDTGTIFQPMVLKIHCIDPLSTSACIGAEKEWEANETEANNMFWSWTYVVISCAALKEIWKQTRFGIGVLCGLMCRAAPQISFVLRKWKPYVHQLSEKPADFCLAFAFYCFCKWEFQTAFLLIVVKSQFSGILSSAQVCTAKNCLLTES